MQVVLDTNVVVSGIFFTGPPYEIIQAWRGGRFRLAMTPEIVTEYDAVLARLCDQFPRVAAAGILSLIVAHSEVVSAPGLPVPESADPDDDKFLACAAATGSEFVVSGDKDLLKVREYDGVRIVRPREFLQALGDE